jgi:ubiquinone/menaquinone biosynthesis C-methylase UbiE/ribosomal protein S18 acetylase RimI-like enzyme
MTECTNYDDAFARVYAAHRAIHPGVRDALAAAIDPSSTVLEIGCGTGNYLRALKEREACDLSGIDPSSAMLAQVGGDLRVAVGSAELLEFPERTFDLVYSVDVIHHVRDRRAAFAEAFRVLRDGGAMCTVTDSESVIRRRALSTYFPETVEVELARYPSMATLRSEMIEAGFRSVDEREVEHEHDVVDADAVRAKVFSSLRHIDDGAFARGLARLEGDLRRGPLRNVGRYTMLWGRREGVGYRRFAPTDSIPKLTEMLHGAYRPLADMGMRFLASHQDDAMTRERVECGETIVAVLAEQVVGTVTVRRPQSSADARWYARPGVASMQQLAVDPAFQGRRIGSELIARAERIARAWGATELALDTSERATALIALYARRGYRIVEQIERDIVNYRSVVMSKTLSTVRAG